MEEDIDIDDRDGKVEEHAADAARLVLGRVVERIEDVLTKRREEPIEDLTGEHSHNRPNTVRTPLIWAPASSRQPIENYSTSIMVKST